MVSRRSRDKNSVGTRLNGLATAIDKVQSSTGIGAAEVVSENIATDAVDRNAIAPNAVGPDQIDRGAVGTNELGIVNEINTDTALALSGAAYTAPAAGHTTPVVFDSNKKLQTGAAYAFFATGTVSTSWVSGTTPSVLLDSGLTVTATLAYLPTPGESVVLGRSDNVWYVIGTNAAPTSYPPLSATMPSINGWGWYHLWTQTPVQYAPAMVHRTSAGMVFVDGLIQAGISGSGAILTAGTVVAQLPAWARPLYDIPFTCWIGSGTIHTGVIVRTNGDIVIEAAATAAQLLSLSNIRYNNDPNLARTALTPSGTWVNYGTGALTTTPEPMQYAVDSVGRTIVEGLVKNASVGSAPNVITSVPAAGKWSQASGLWLMYSQVTSSRFSRVDSPYTGNTTGGISASGTAAQAAQSIHHNFLKDSMATNYLALGYSNGSNYGSGWNTLGVAKLNDGACKLKGLTAAMTVNVNGFVLPGAFAPKYDLIFAVEATDTAGRLDVTSVGGIVNRGGTNTFMSVEGMEWLPNTFPAN